MKRLIPQQKFILLNKVLNEEINKTQGTKDRLPWLVKEKRREKLVRVFALRGNEDSLRI